MSRKYYDRLLGGSAVVTSKKFHSDFGASILKKFGWSQGEGLGKERSGTVDPVIIAKRAALSGLGTEKEKKDGQWNNWWEDLYNTTAQKIQCQPSAVEKRSKSTSQTEETAERGTDREVKGKKRKREQNRESSDSREDVSEASTRVSDADDAKEEKKKKLKTSKGKSDHDLASAMSKAKRQKGKLERIKAAEAQFLQNQQLRQSPEP